MAEVFKLLHIPTGLYCTSYRVYEYQDKKNPGLRASMNKKGRTWKRYNDVLIAYQTIQKELRARRRENLINDYTIEIFELVSTNILSKDEITEQLNIKNAAYEKRKLEEEKSRLAYRLKQAQSDVQRYKDSIPQLNKEIEKLTQKLNAYK